MSDYWQKLWKPDRAVEITAVRKDEALQELVDLLAKFQPLTSPKDLLESLIQRERQNTTGIGGGVAIPHVRSPQVSEVICLCGRSPKGVEFAAMDAKPVHLIFLLIAPPQGDYLKVLAKISKSCLQAAFIDRLLSAGGCDQMLDVLRG